MQSDFKEYEDRFKKRGNSEEFILRRKREFPALVNLFNNTLNHGYEKITIKPNQFLEETLVEYGINLNERMK